MFEGALDDRIALRELIDRYSDAVMSLNVDDYGDCWADDGEWAFRGQEICGRVEIVKFWKGAIAEFQAIMFMSQPGSIKVDADEARMITHTLEHLVLLDGSIRLQAGTYNDFAVRTDRWRFARREFKARELKV